MADDVSAPQPRFAWFDLDEWVARGLIQPEQVGAIRAHLLGTPTAVPTTPVERRAGINLVTIAYFFGAFMILLAYTIFMGLQWEALGKAGQVGVAGGTIAALWGLGTLLRHHGYRLGGNLLVLAGTAIVPLAAYTLLRAAGLWPESADAGAYRDFYRRIDPAWLSLEVASGAVALVALWRTRFPLLTLLVAFWAWYLSMDLAEWVTGHDDLAWSTTEWTVGAAIGLAMLGAGVWLQRARNASAYSFWLYLFGHVALLGNLSALAWNDGVWLGFLFLVVYLGFIVASVWLQARVFLVFGALGCYAYVARLAFDVFEGSLGFVFALAALGLLIVLTAVAYQRYIAGWLARRLAGGKALGPAA